MEKFGLVVLGAHTGFHIKPEIIKCADKKVLLVEPVPYNIVEIKKNLGEFKNILIEPITISDKAEIKKFYHLKASSFDKLKKHWASGIGSFNKLHLLNHKSKRFNIQETDIEEIQIQSIRFKDLVEKYSIKQIEKLIIDVEGSEYEILKDIDLKTTVIKKIIFEYKHFDGYQKTGDKFKEILSKLNENNYKSTKIDEENVLSEKI